MIKHLLATAIITLPFLGLRGQQVYEVVPVSGGSDLVGTEITFDISGSSEIHFTWNVKNVSGAPIQAEVARRVLIEGAPSWEDVVCFGVTCYPASSSANWTGSQPVSLNHNETALADLKIYPNGGPANALYRYYFGSSNNPYMDSVDVRVRNVLSVKEPKKTLSLSVAPNPANDYLTIKAPVTDNASIKVVDVLGNVILMESFNGSKTINTAAYRNGVYFVILSGEGLNGITRKVVVKH